MAVKIVTDSSADLPEEIVKELGITVVPLYLRFGEEVFRDRVDISEDEFYERLLHDPIHPSTTQPTPTRSATTASGDCRSTRCACSTARARPASP